MSRRARELRKAVRKAFADFGALHINQPLTNVAIAYVQGTDGFVARRLFPVVPVNKQSDRYWVFERDNRDEFQKRAPATESAGITMSLSTDTYFAEKWALHIDIAYEEYANADSPINLDTMATQRLMLKGLIRQERIFVDTWFQSGVWTGQSGGVTSSPSSTQFIMWDDPTSTPVEDIRAAKTQVKLNSGGYTPNKLALDERVYNKLIDHPDIVDRIKYGGGPDRPAVVSRAALAALFEVEQVLVLGAVENTAKEGLTETNAFMAGKHALLLYSPNAPSIREPSAGYTFSWTGYLGNAPDGIAIEKFDMRKLKADRVEAEMFFDMKKTASDLGWFFYQAIR